jgi:iron(III) transport system permease protein
MTKVIDAAAALPQQRRAGLAKRPAQTNLLALAMLLVIACLVLPPVVTLVQNSLFLMNPDGSHGAFTLDNFTHLVSEKGILASGWNSIQFAALSTLFSLLFGASLAWVVERTDAPHRSLAYLMTVVSLGIPLIIYVPAWLFLLGPVGPFNELYRNLTGNGGNLFAVNSIAGMVAIETLGWLPMSFLLFAASFRTANAELEEAARMSGAGILTMVLRISIPLAAPAALATGLFIFIKTLQAFDVPKLVGTSAGIKLLTTDIYDDIRAAVPPRVGHASAYSVVLTVLVAGLMYLYSRLSLNASRFATVTGKGFRPRPLPLGRLRWLGGALIWANCIVVLVLPILTLLWIALTPFVRPVRVAAFKSLTLDNFRVVLGSQGYFELIVNTLITAAVAASVTMALMVVCGWLVARRQAFHAVTDQLITLPMILPGIVLSVAMMDVALRAPIPLYSTLTIVVIAFVIHFLPFGMRYTYGGVLQIHKELEESAGVCGASPGKILLKVVMPLLWPAIMAGWVFIFLNASRDLSTAIILAGPDTKTIAVAIFDRAVNGELSEVAALGLLWSLLMSTIATGFYLAMKRRGTMIFGV